MDRGRPGEEISVTEKRFSVLAHGGAGSKNEYADGTQVAVRAGLAALRSQMGIVEAVCRAVVVLEDDSRFNAGFGSHKRSDGRIQMDAAVMDSRGAFGAVAALSGFKNPVHVARAVSQSPYRLLAGEGADQFAAAGAFEPYPKIAPSGDSLDFSNKEEDTVGAVACDGETFAAALSTGGTSKAIPGRVGDCPLIGCGLYAGPSGAVACTGKGEAIIDKITAFQAYQLIEEGLAPQEIVDEVVGWFPDDPFGLILVTPSGFAGGSNRAMAWSAGQVFP